jgi:hypothetical protein
MFTPHHQPGQRIASLAIAAAFLVSGHALSTRAQSNESSAEAPLGRINFDKSLPPASVEIDLSQEMVASLFGIGDAAAAGIADTLQKSASADNEKSAGTRMAAEQLAAVQQILGLTSKVVREVRVRAYEKLGDDLSSRFDDQLDDANWEKIAVVRHGDENARVYLARSGESIRGAFIMAGSREGQVLVNVVCDISPDNVKKLTSAATKIGLENGLREELEAKFRKLRGPHAPELPSPPRPPQPPRPEAT